MNARLTSAQRQVGAATLAGLAPRAALLLFGLAATALATPARVLLVLALAGLVVSAVMPERSAAAAPAVVLAVAWMVDHGSGATAPDVRTVAFALALYLLTSAGALAGAVPVDARVEAAVYRRWARGLVVPCVAAVAVGAVLAVPGELPGSSLTDVVGLLGAVGVLIVIVRAVGRR